jgi:bifunctional pyridoxal-dependent enzyme with beta-cystathionase and maltose regulon repressor activities
VPSCNPQNPCSNIVEKKSSQILRELCRLHNATHSGKLVLHLVDDDKVVVVVAVAKLVTGVLSQCRKVLSKKG